MFIPGKTNINWKKKPITLWVLSQPDKEKNKFLPLGFLHQNLKVLMARKHLFCFCFIFSRPVNQTCKPINKKEKTGLSPEILES